MASNPSYNLRNRKNPDIEVEKDFPKTPEQASIKKVIKCDASDLMPSSRIPQIKSDLLKKEGFRSNVSKVGIQSKGIPTSRSGNKGRVTSGTGIPRPLPKPCDRSPGLKVDNFSKKRSDFASSYDSTTIPIEQYDASSPMSCNPGSSFPLWEYLQKQEEKMNSILEHVSRLSPPKPCCHDQVPSVTQTEFVPVQSVDKSEYTNTQIEQLQARINQLFRTTINPGFSAMPENVKTTVIHAAPERDPTVSSDMNVTDPHISKKQSDSGKNPSTWSVSGLEEHEYELHCEERRSRYTSPSYESILENMNELISEDMEYHSPPVLQTHKSEKKGHLSKTDSLCAASTSSASAVITPECSTDETAKQTSDVSDSSVTSSQSATIQRYGINSANLCDEVKEFMETNVFGRYRVKSTRSRKLRKSLSI